MNKGLFTSKTGEWETPQEFYDKLNEEFRFTLDPCATKKNAKCKKFYTKEDDGLSKDWSGERVFLNPPYGKEVGKWVKKASESKCLIVCLLPARTDTRWFHQYIYHKSEIRFIKGRLKFSGSSNSAPFPSMIIVFSGKSGV